MPQSLQPPGSRSTAYGTSDESHPPPSTTTRHATSNRTPATGPVALPASPYQGRTPHRSSPESNPRPHPSHRFQPQPDHPHRAHDSSPVRSTRRRPECTTPYRPQANQESRSAYPALDSYPPAPPSIPHRSRYTQKRSTQHRP